MRATLRVIAAVLLLLTALSALASCHRHHLFRGHHRGHGHSGHHYSDHHHYAPPGCH